MTRTYRVELADTTEKLRAAYRLRYEVFIQEQGYGTDRDLDNLDEVGVPMVLVREDSNEVVGVMRILPYPLPEGEERFYPDAAVEDDPLVGDGRSAAQMADAMLGAQKVSRTGSTVTYSGIKVGRFAVRKTERGQGGGRIMLAGAESWWLDVLQTVHRGDGVEIHTRSQLSAQEHALPFYEAQGYHVEGDKYLEEGQPHAFCVKPLSVPASSP